MPAAILIGSSISLQDTDKPFQWMEFGKFQDLLARASSVVKDHVMNSFFKDYLLSSAFVGDIGNRGMLLQRLKETKPSLDGLFVNTDGIVSYLESLVEGMRGQQDVALDPLHESSRVYAFSMIDGLDVDMLTSLMTVSRADESDPLAGFDCKSLASLLNCRSLASRLENVGCDIGVETYLAYRSGEWLYFAYDEVFQEGLVICEHEVGFNPSTGLLLDALMSNALDDTSG
jgi:hypothetical protein